MFKKLAAMGISAALVAASCTQPIPTESSASVATLAVGGSAFVRTNDGATAVFERQPDFDGAVDIEIANLEINVADTAFDPATGASVSPVSSRAAVRIEAESDSGAVSSFPHDVETSEPDDDGTPAVVTSFVPGIEIAIPVSAAELAELDMASVGMFSRESASDPWVRLPSAYDARRGAVVAQSDHLSEFAVMAAPEPLVMGGGSGAAGPTVVLDPDDDVGSANWPGGMITELPFNLDLAEQVKPILEDACGADVVITRGGDQYVSAATRAAVAANADPDVSVTLAFNAFTGFPWGVEADGGVRAWATGGSNTSLADRFLTSVPEFTGRPSTLGVSPPDGLLPYSEFAGVPGDHAHVEVLFLDHNYDHPVIDTAFNLAVDGVADALADDLIAKGFDCDGSLLPDPPSAEELSRLRNLGFQNYQRYGADPISFSTGNFTTQEETFELRGVGDQVIDMTLSYNAQDGRPSRFGVGWQFQLGSATQLFGDDSVHVVLGDGRSFLYEPDGGGGYVEPDGANATLTRAGTTLTFATANGESYGFVESEDTGIGALASHTDRQGNTTALTYGPPNANGVLPLTAATDAAGQSVSFGFDEFARVTTVAHPDGRVWGFTYDAAGDLVTITDPTGLTRQFGYDAEHRIVTQTGRDGVVYLTNTYDALDRVVGQVDAVGNTRTIIYNPGETIHVDNNGNQTTYRYNSLGQVTEVVDALGNTTTSGFDGDYNTTAETDANGNTWAFEFDTSGNLVTSTDPAGVQVTNSYSAGSDLTSMTDEGGVAGAARTTTFSVSAQGRVTQTLYADGSTTATSYSSSGDPTVLTDENGHQTALSYDDRGNVISSTDPLGHETVFAFDLANRLTAVTDANGDTTTYTYDLADNLTSVTDPLGGVTGFAFGANNELLSQTDPDGHATAFAYDDNLNLITVTNPDGTTVVHSYDDENNLTATTDARGNTTSFGLDPLYRVALTTEPTGAELVNEYDPNGNITASIDGEDNRTEYTYDHLDRQTTVTDPTGAVTTTVYDRVGRVVEVIDGRGNSRTFEYDLRDRLTAETNEEGHTTSYRYDLAGNLTSRTDANLNVTTFQYDAANRLVAEVDPLGNVTLTGYDPVGNPVSTVDANGNVTTTEHDANGRVTATIDAAGYRTESSYDPAGNLTQVTDARGGTIDFTYDTRNRLATQSDQNGHTTSYGYDGNSNRTAMVAADGVITTYEHDSMNRLAAVVENVVIGGIQTNDENVRTAYGYDLAGRRTAITDANGNTTAFTFDGNDRVLSETNPLGETWTYNYDANGNESQRLTPTGQTIDSTYAPDNQLTGISPSGESDISFSYDPANNRTGMTDGIGSSTWIYDALNRVTTTTDSADRTLGYTYDSVGNMTSLTNIDGSTTSYTFDELNLMASLTSPWQTTSYSYDASANLIEETRSNGTAVARSYDPANQLTDIIHTGRATGNGNGGGNGNNGGVGNCANGNSNANCGGGNCGNGNGQGNAPCNNGNGQGNGNNASGEIIAGTRYVFDAVGNVIARDDLTGPTSANTNTYTYDPLRRLTESVSDIYGTTSYTFDPVGNRLSLDSTDNPDTSKPSDPYTVTYSYNDANQLTGSTAVTGTGNSAKMVDTGYIHDEAGRLVEAIEDGQGPDKVIDHTYNYNDQLTSSSEHNRSTTHEFDGIGRRLLETSGPGNSSKTTIHTYDGLDPIADTAHNGHETIYVRGATGLVDHQGTHPESTVHTYHHDGLGNVTGLSRENGRLEDTVTYTDYGRPRDKGGYSSNLAWNEQPWDSDFDLTHYYARSYDPAVGRWNSPDPYRGDLAEPASLHRRSFLGGNPVGAADGLGFARVAALQGNASALVYALLSGTTSTDDIARVAFQLGLIPHIDWRRLDWSDLGIDWPSFYEVASSAVRTGLQTMVFRAIEAGAERFGRDAYSAPFVVGGRGFNKYGAVLDTVSSANAVGTAVDVAWLGYDLYRDLTDPDVAGPKRWANASFTISEAAATAAGCATRFRGPVACGIWAGGVDAVGSLVRPVVEASADGYAGAYCSLFGGSRFTKWITGTTTGC